MSNNTLLIDKRVMEKFVQLTGKRNEARINQEIRDAQGIDMANLICEKYLTDLILHRESYKELIKGGSYEVGGITYINPGLEIVLSYFAYARYVLNGSYTDTAFGFVEKNNQHSHQTSEQTREKTYTFNRQKAITYWNSVKNFLIRTNYKNYNSICADMCGNETKMSGFRLNVISK